MRSPWHHNAQVPVYINNIRTREASNPLSALPGPASVALSPYAVDPASAIRHFEVRVTRPASACLVLEYELLGDLDRVSVREPIGHPDHPTDGLWRHTCMEVFVSPGVPGAYLEFNFAPSGQWAAYRFSGYRAGMAPLTGLRPPRIELRRQSDRLLLSADVELPADLAGAHLRLGLAAVVEDTIGRIDYWALRHAGERPDFHHPDSFGFEI
jgi:hypothetical protein